MRIDDLNRSLVTQTQGTEKTDPAAEKGAAEKNGIADGADQGDVSPLAQALVTRDPNRLEQLRLQVQSGKYEVSAAEVATSIINAHVKD